MDMTPNPKIANTFIGKHSSKPICGVCTLSAYKRTLTEVRVETDKMAAGTLVKISFNGTGDALSGFGHHSATATKDETTPNGVLIDSPNFLQEEFETAPLARAGQVVFAARFGSGTELYMPCDNSLSTWNGTTAIGWDTINGCLKVGATPTVPVVVMSKVVNGVKAVNNGGKGEFTNSLCVKVKI